MGFAGRRLAHADDSVVRHWHGRCYYSADDDGRHDWGRCLDFTVRNLEVLPIQAMTAYIKPRESMVRVIHPDYGHRCVAGVQLILARGSATGVNDQVC